MSELTDEGVKRTLSIVFGGIGVMFIAMIFIARAIVY